jgi:hypothetical protein
MSFNQTNNGPLSVTGGHVGAWVFSDRIVDGAAHTVGGSLLSQRACLQSRASAACIGKLREVLVYQPASRYWAFQSYGWRILSAWPSSVPRAVSGGYVVASREQGQGTRTRMPGVAGDRAGASMQLIPTSHRKWSQVSGRP